MELDNPVQSKYCNAHSKTLFLVLDKVRSELFSNGKVTVRSLGTTFSAFDSNGNRAIDKQELYWGLKNLGSTISKREAHILLEYLDTNKDGNVDYNEFLFALRGLPNEHRQEVIQRAFDKFDIYREGTV